MAYQPKSYRKFVATAATATLVAGAVAPFASAADASKFTDVSKSYQDAVNFVVSKGANGKTETTFGTSENITRVDAAVLLVKVLGLDTEGAPASGFKDVPARAVKEVNALKAAGITSGKSETTFNSNAKITRGELAVWIQRGFALEGSAAVNFKDVNSNYYQAVSALVANKVTSGKTPTTFGTSHNATRGEYAIFLYKAFQASDAIAVSSVKAINATTVEVTYKEKVTVEDIAASKYTIDGLEVKNAAIKQTDSKTVVLTTAAQEAGKSYTVKNNGTTVGSFTGVSAVIPTAVDVTTSSLQGVIGQEVTLKAQVTVKEGDSKAGVPVTFNIVNGNSNNKTIEVEATTNADGVATYSYTRYYASEDNVTAYATVKSSVYSVGKVYWDTTAQLTIKDVNGLTSVVNNDKKVYEINSAKNAEKFVFVAFKENVGVTADKVVRTVFAEGSRTYLLNTNNSVNELTNLGAQAHPYEITTGSKAVIAVKLDAKGKANLVLTGANGTVTPVVYEGVATDSNDAGSIAGDLLAEFTNASYNATALQAAAPTVKFEAKHSLGLTIEAQGVANAATYKNPNETGGRDYQVTYVDKDGKPAPATTKVQVAIPVQAASNGVFLVDEDGNKVQGRTVGENRVFEIAVSGKEGKASFTVSSELVTQYVEPIAWIDNGTGVGAKVGLDATDLQTKGAATHFTESVEYKSSLKLVDAAGKEIKSVYANGVEAANFQYDTVDQNGKPRAYRLADGTLPTAATNVTFSVTTGTSPVIAKGFPVTAGNPLTVNETVAIGATSTTLPVIANAPTTATVSATASVAGLVLATTNSVTATFTNTSTANVTGTVTAVNKTTGVVTIGSVPYALSGATYLNNGTVVPTLAAFYDHLTVGKEVSITKDADGNLVFNVKGLATSTQSLFTAFEDNAAGLLSDAEFKNLLKSVAGFNGLTNASQNAALVAIKGSGAANAEDLADAIEVAIFDEYVNELEALAAVPGTTYTDVVTLVAKIPGASAAATALRTVTNTGIQDAIIVDLQTLSATTAAGLVTEINQAILTAQQAAVQAAVAAVTGAASVTAFETALKANNTVDTSKTNAQILGINLSTVANADMTDVMTSLYGKKATLNALNAATLFAEAVALETTVPEIKTAVYDETAGKLTITFTKAVDPVTGTLAEADLTLVGIRGATVAITDADAAISTTAGVTTLVIDIASNSGILTATSITLAGLTTANGAAAITLQDTANDPHTFVLGNFTFTLAQ